MFMKRTLKYLIPIMVFLLLIRLFCGVFKDDEFNDNYFFIKKYPTFKWYFHSPRGMSDLKLNEMSKNQSFEQVMYDKYVTGRLFEIPIPDFK